MEDIENNDKKEDNGIEETKKKESDNDEEGLSKSGYDVIICGTSLVHSIVASALSLAGKRILHCDGADYYGELDTSMNLLDALSWAENSSKKKTYENCNNKKISNTINLNKEGSCYGIFIHSYSKNHLSDEYQDSISKSRKFILDLTIQGPLLFANDKAVSGLISSNVSDYVEFKSLCSLYILQSNQNKTKKIPLSSSTIIETADDKKSSTFSFHRVPCSKSDVFLTTLLSPLEKRKLMKFLQLILDYGISQQSSAIHHTDDDEELSQNVNSNEFIQSQNERKLNQGRSLSRPQNKSISTTALEQLQSLMNTSKKDSYSENDNLNLHYLHVYLQKELKLSPRLTQLIIYSLALQVQAIPTTITTPNHNSAHTTVQQGIKALSKHLHSIGRFGKTAFLVPLYGCGELSQSFCRSAAVHGGVYLLRRCPRQIIVPTLYHKENESNSNNVKLNSQHENSMLSVNIMGDPYLSMQQNEKKIFCKHVIVSKASISNAIMIGQNSSNTKKDECTNNQIRTIKRISILNGTIQNPESSKERTTEEDDHEDGQSMIIVIPPMTPNIDNTHAIQGVLLDHTSNVAPHNYTIVHLSTIVNVDEKSNLESIDYKMLERAMTFILSHFHAKNTNNDPCNDDNKTDQQDVTLNEIHHICFSTIYDLDENHGLDSRQVNHPNIHISAYPSQSLTVDHAFEEAEQIFHSICNPNNDSNDKVPFLEICPELEKIRNEFRNIGYGDEDKDDEEVVLESAFRMMDAKDDSQTNDNPKEEVIVDDDNGEAS